MRKSDIKSMPEYFDRYINLVPDVELAEAFTVSLNQLDAVDRDLLKGLEGKTYAPGKFTVKEILQHVIDWERILSQRALLFARQEGSIPPAIDEERLAAATKADARSVDSLLDELKIVRAATRAMYESFDDETLQNTGTNWKSEMSVFEMGLTILGHQAHHLKIIEDRYFQLA